MIDYLRLLQVYKLIVNYYNSDGKQILLPADAVNYLDAVIFVTAAS